jgi:hypothetical protein
VTTTVAPVTAAPLWSETVPRMRPVVDCARAGKPKAQIINTMRNIPLATLATGPADMAVHRNFIGASEFWSDSHTIAWRMKSRKFASTLTRNVPI